MPLVLPSPIVTMSSFPSTSKSAPLLASETPSSIEIGKSKYLLIKPSIEIFDAFPI